MKDYRLKKTLSSSVTFFAVLSLILSVFIMPVFATGTEVESSGHQFVELESPNKVFNDDGSVTAVYDVPLNPYAFIYGKPSDADGFTLVSTGSAIHFEQTAEHTLQVFQSLYSFSGTFVEWHTYYQGYYGAENFSGLPFDPDLVTHAIIDGVSYDVTVGTTGQDYFFGTDSDVIVMRLRYNPEFYFQVVFPDAGFHSVSLGYYSEELVPADYEKLYINAWPLGYNQATQLGNVIKVSDLRSGANFSVDVTFDANVQLENQTNDFNVVYTSYFYDQYGNELDRLDDTFNVESFFGSTSLSDSFTFTVPDGAAYFDILFAVKDLNTSDVVLLDWRISQMELSVDMSAVESESQMMQGIQDKLDELNEQQQETNDKLDEIISGTPGANAGADNMQDVAGDYKDHVNNQLQNGQAQMDKLDQLPRPDVSGAVTLPEWATSDQFLGFNAVVATIWENETIYEIMLVASILMLASYILFGKKV